MAIKKGKGRKSKDMSKIVTGTPMEKDTKKVTSTDVESKALGVGAAISSNKEIYDTYKGYVENGEDTSSTGVVEEELKRDEGTVLKSESVKVVLTEEMSPDVLFKLDKQNLEEALHNFNEVMEEMLKSTGTKPLDADPHHVPGKELGEEGTEYYEAYMDDIKEAIFEQTLIGKPFMHLVEKDFPMFPPMLKHSKILKFVPSQGEGKTLTEDARSRRSHSGRLKRPEEMENLSKRRVKVSQDISVEGMLDVENMLSPKGKAKAKRLLMKMNKTRGKLVPEGKELVVRVVSQAANNDRVVSYGPTLGVVPGSEVFRTRSSKLQKALGQQLLGTELMVKVITPGSPDSATVMSHRAMHPSYLHSSVGGKAYMKHVKKYGTQIVPTMLDIIYAFAGMYKGRLSNTGQRGLRDLLVVRGDYYIFSKSRNGPDRPAVFFQLMEGLRMDFTTMSDFERERLTRYLNYYIYKHYLRHEDVEKRELFLYEYMVETTDRYFGAPDMNPSTMLEARLAELLGGFILKDLYSKRGGRTPLKH